MSSTATATTSAPYYRVITPNGHGGGTVGRMGDTRDREAAYADAARIPGAYVEVSPNGVTGWDDDTAPAPTADAPAAPTPAAPTYPAPGVRVPTDAPIGSPLTARGAIGTVRGTLHGWAASALGMRPVVAYTRHGREYRSALWDTVTATPATR